MGMMVGLQMGMETALFSISGVMIGWLGTVPLAAHQVVASISTLGFMVYMELDRLFLSGVIFLRAGDIG